MRYIIVFILLLSLSAVVVFACTKLRNQENGSMINSGATLGFSEQQQAPERNTSSQVHSFHYPNYTPYYDESMKEYVLENFKIRHRTFIADLYSIAASLTYFFYGFYPQTIEEMYEKGLVPYKITGEDYEFTKYWLSIGFTCVPGSAEPGGSDLIRFRERVDFENADPSVIMQFKGELMRREIGSASNALPSLYSFSSMEVLIPGVRDNTYMYMLSKDLELNPAFWTNPYTGEPMKQCSTESPTKGDFSCKVLEGNIYEVQFYVE